jgi:hypothetical protein
MEEGRTQEERRVPMTMPNHVKLVTRETCQMYGMRTIVVIDASPVMGEHGASGAVPSGRCIVSGMPTWDAWNRLRDDSWNNLIRLAVMEARWVK